MQNEKERFRSFAERYVIERAGQWKAGEEDTGAWTAIQDAKRIYKQIAQQGDQVQVDIYKQIAQQGDQVQPSGAGIASQAPVIQGLYAPPSDQANKYELAKKIADPATPTPIRKHLMDIWNNLKS